MDTTIHINVADIPPEVGELMIVYGITAEQAAARAPAAQFAVTSVIAALFVWLDSMGMFDDVGRWMGRKLREVLDAVSD